MTNEQIRQQLKKHKISMSEFARFCKISRAGLYYKFSNPNENFYLYGAYISYMTVGRE